MWGQTLLHCVFLRPGWAGLWLASCLPVALNSGVRGRGTDRQVRSSEDKDGRSLAGSDWLNCPDGSPQTPVTPLTGKLPRGAWEGGFLMASSPGPEKHEQGSESITWVPFHFTDWFGCTALESNQPQKYRNSLEYAEGGGDSTRC